MTVVRIRLIVGGFPPYLNLTNFNLHLQQRTSTECREGVGGWEAYISEAPDLKRG